MIENGDHQLPTPRWHSHRCRIVGGTILGFLLLLFLIILILALSVFKARAVHVHLLSASLGGVSPRISSFPIFNVVLNLTLNLTLLVDNPNYASFRHGPGKSLLLYQGNQMGEANIDPGLIPSMGDVTIPCRLTVEGNELSSNLKSLLNDILAGQLVMETRTTIPGRITFLGIFKKHAVANSACKFTFVFPDAKIQRRECKNKAE